MSKKRFWIGIIICAAIALFLTFDSIIHMLPIKQVTDGFIQLGYSPSLGVPLGMVELICVILYVIPQTSILGAILLTGYLGGAVASNLRIGDPFFSLTLSPVYIGILLWLGLYLLDKRVRALVPLRKREESNSAAL